MPHPYSFNQVQIIGDCWESSEIWTTSFSMGSITQGSEDPTLAHAQIIADAWETFFTTSSSGITENYRTLAVKYNKQGTDGRQITDPTVEYVYPTPPFGASATFPMPPQISLVASLRTENSRGLATKGRMYLPVNGFTVQDSGKINPAVISPLLANFKLFLNTLSASIDLPGGPILTSPAGLLGATNIITRVAFGDVYDTQRRRRNGLPEVYAETPLDSV